MDTANLQQIIDNAPTDDEIGRYRLLTTEFKRTARVVCQNKEGLFSTTSTVLDVDFLARRLKNIMKTYDSILLPETYAERIKKLMGALPGYVITPNGMVAMQKVGDYHMMLRHYQGNSGQSLYGAIAGYRVHTLTLMMEAQGLTEQQLEDVPGALDIPYDYPWNALQHHRAANPGYRNGLKKLEERAQKAQDAKNDLANFKNKDQ